MVKLFALLKVLSAFAGAVRSFFTWLSARQAKQAGRDEERARQADATVDVLEKNAEAVAEADAMNDAEMRRRLTDGQP